jgi:hypothetical protein
MCSTAAMLAVLRVVVAASGDRGVKVAGVGWPGHANSRPGGRSANLSGAHSYLRRTLRPERRVWMSTGSIGNRDAVHT